jgi:prepilin-type N-terminal cleavage/methylation domain-containing protein
MRRLRNEERGYSLIELLVVMAILGVIVGALTTIFVSGSHAELDLNRRFQAQQQVRLGLDAIRADIHCASAAQAKTIGTYPGLKLAINNTSGLGNCSAAATVSWCVVQVSSTPSRYALYRSTGTTNICTSTDTGRRLVADYLTTSTNVFTTAATISQYSLQTVGVDFRVSVNPTTTQDIYELSDTIVARNSTRCTTSGGCTAPTVS